MGARGNSGVILCQILRGIAGTFASCQVGRGPRGGRRPRARAAQPRGRRHAPRRRHDAHRRRRRRRGCLRRRRRERRRRPAEGLRGGQASGRRVALAHARPAAGARAGRRRRRRRGRPRAHVRRLPPRDRRAPARRRAAAAARGRRAASRAASTRLGDGWPGRRRRRSARGAADDEPEPTARRRRRTCATRSCTSSRRPTRRSRPSRTSGPGIGDSIVVVGGDGLWNCHIHTDDIGAAIEAALDVGRPRDIRVTDLLDQVEEESWVRRAEESGATAPPSARRARPGDLGRRRRHRRRHPPHLPLPRRAPHRRPGASR